MNFYNDIDAKVCAWLEELIRAGLIPNGVVDNRSIDDITPSELMQYTQVHMFCGIAGWPLALQLAGIPADYPVWTGSCPCQPFSAAGKGDGFADERHLWPAFHWLIDQCRPPVVVGEQVASAAVNAWLDLVLTDLEALGFAVGAYAGPAAGVGAPHIRDRTYWVASAADTDRQGLPRQVWGGAAGETDAASAWRAIERVHAARAWASWLSESGIGALADGIPARVGRLRGYGNAIVPQQAAEFLKAVLA